MGKILIDNKEIKRVFKGNKEIYNIYQGNTQLWQNFKAIDLGLPSGTLWADRNLGAISIDDYGKEYSWGHITDNYENSWENYMCSAENCGDEENDPLVSIGAIYKDRDDEWFGDISGREFDATISKGNSEWRLPTVEEFEELFLYSIQSSSEKGITFRGQRDANNTQTPNKIFLPFTENVSGNIEQLNNFKHGYYWTGTINSGNAKQAFSMVISSAGTQIYDHVTSRFIHLAIRPVMAKKPNKPNISFETNSLTIYKGDSKSLYFEITPELSTDKKVYFQSSSSDVTVTNTGYITVNENVTDNNATITATLNNGNTATCEITILPQEKVSNIILKDKNGSIFTENNNNINITIDEWSSTWVLPSLVNSNNTSEGIINKNLKWEVTSGSDKVFIVPLYDMYVGWADSVPSEYDCHPIKIFGLSEGNATVRVTYQNSDNTTVIKYFNVTVNAYTKKCNGHNYVNLGLSGNDYWSTENVGANDYSYTGDYYSWGETAPKDETTENYSMSYYSPQEGTIGTYVFLGNNISNTEYDVASTEWEGRWHMPSKNDVRKLSTLNRAHVKIGSNIFILIMGLNNDNYILLRQNGYKHQTSISRANYCFYWTSTCNASTASNMTSTSVYFLYTKYGFRFYSDCENNYATTLTVASGLGVRPIYTFAAPIISINNSMNTCTLSHIENNVTIYYTTDDTDPAISNTRIEYRNNLSISMENINILRAVAIDQDNNISREASSTGASSNMYNVIIPNNENYMESISTDEDDQNFATSTLDDLMNNGWGQCYPDAMFSPKCKMYGGTHYTVGGCTAHSRAQAMWHYKWPIIRKFKTYAKTYFYKPLSGNSDNQYYNLIGDTINYAFGNYTMEESKRFNYNNILPKYITSDLTESNVGYLVTNVKTIPFNYSSESYVSKGVQYTYEQAAEWSNFLLDFGRIIPLSWGPFATGGSTPESNKKMERDYQYSRKQFYLQRSNITKKLFEEILKYSFDNNMPVTATSTGHAWLISGYDDTTQKYYIQLNEGEVSRSAGTNIDRLVTGKYYSYIPGTSNKSAVSIEIEAGITPNCIKSIKDYFIVYTEYIYRRNNTELKQMHSYISKIILAGIEYINYEQELTFAKTQTVTLYSSIVGFRGNAVPEKVYIAVCLENIKNENSEPIILKKVWHTPKANYRMSTCSSSANIIINNLNLLDVPNGQYKLTLRYSTDDGETYSEQVILPDTYEIGPETVNITIDDDNVTINFTYDSYSNINS